MIDAIPRFILNHEARRDAQGRLVVYKLPAGDGGGEYEVAGINARYHPQAAAALKELIEAGRHEDAEHQAALHIGQYVAGPAGWAGGRPGVALMIADAAFNRGHAGAAWIAQHALGFMGAELDGAYGPKTAAALQRAIDADPAAFCRAYRVSREVYERTPVRRFSKGARDESSQFWRGLSRRWDECLTEALQLEADYVAPAAPKPKVAAPAAAVAVGGGGAGIAAIAAEPSVQAALSQGVALIGAYGARPVLIAVGIAVAAAGAYLIYRRIKS